MEPVSDDHDGDGGERWHERDKGHIRSCMLCTKFLCVVCIVTERHSNMLF